MTPATPAHRILLVDDEVKVLNGLGRSLSQEPYELTTTTSPEEAIRLLASQEFTAISRCPKCRECNYWSMPRRFLRTPCG
jgi:CheY-like chemotaxis protein